MDFVANTEKDQKEMLSKIGVNSVEELFSDMPEDLRKASLKLSSGLSEQGLLDYFEKIGRKNKTTKDLLSFLGAGAYEHFIPEALNYIASLPGFATPYTPYQAEASQGTLQTIYEYQTLICQLTGMDVANASLYDGATAVAEAANLSFNVTSKKKILVAKTLHPEYQKVLKTYFAQKLEIIEIGFSDGVIDFKQLKENLSEDAASLILQQPNFFGCLEDVQALEKMVHQAGVLLVVAVNPISLGILKRPGDFGADIVVGEGQPLGIPLNFGGPYLGFLATREKFLRQIPGRLVGQTKDKEGKRGYVLVLQTREQHIRRERATSNICTNSALNALRAAVYLSLLGKQGLYEVAELNLQKAHYLAEEISKISGFSLRFSQPFFNEFVVKMPDVPEVLIEKCLKRKIIPGFALGRFYPELKDSILVCVTETKSRKNIDKLVEVLKSVSANASASALRASADEGGQQ